jgi:Holliday junction DNA helicase RuvA
MIATLEGIVSEKLDDITVISVGGVGYGVQMPLYARTDAQSGASIKLYVYEHIRETGHDLYGFREYTDKQFFELLLSVNGVGPKMALNIMNVGSYGEVRQAIANADSKLIQQASGVGKRVAERIIVELKNKVGLIAAELDASGLLASDAMLYGDEAAQALTALGYSTQDAMRALAKIDQNLPTEERIKLALKAGA